MNYPIEAHIARLEQRLQTLSQRMEIAEDAEGLVKEAVEALSETLDDLRATQEELSAQNEASCIAQAQPAPECPCLMSLLDFALEAYLVTDTQGVIGKANGAAAALFGLQQEQMKGESLAHFVTDADREAFCTWFDQGVLDPESSGPSREFCLQPLQREPCKVMMVVAPVSEAVRQTSELCWLIRDVSEQKQTAEALAEQTYALRESEARFDLFMEHLPAAVYIKGADERIIYANTRVADFLGLEKEALIGVRAEDITPPYLLKQYHAENQRVLDGEIVESESVFPDSDGTPHHWLTYKFPLHREPAQALIGTVALDITEQKQTEQALRESEQRFRTLFHNVKDGVFVHPILPGNQPGPFELVNEAACEMLGYSPAALSQMTPWDLDDPDSRGAHIPEAMRQLQAQGHAVFEALQVSQNGRKVLVEVNAHVINLQGRPHIISVVRDITKRKQREDAWRFQARLLDAVGQAVIVTETSGAIIYWNKAAEETYGWSKAEVMGQNILEITPTLISKEEGAEIMARLRAGESWSGEFPVQRRDGSFIPAIVTDTPIRDDEGNLSAIIGVTTDITERKAAEEKIAHYAAELERSNRDLEQFAYIISHDLREPLRTITGYLGLLGSRYRSQLDDKADLYIDYAVTGAERMQEMIRALLDLSRVGTRGKPFVPVDVERVLTRVLDSLEQAIVETGAEINYEPLPTVMADKVQLAQVFQNLIANALKFRRVDVPPRVDISAERQEGAWLFSVTDNGIGIDPEQKKRLFKVFQRLHTNAEYPGVGIGLALCRHIVERHRGKIWIESVPGKGATFKFTLPVPEEPA